MSTATVKIRAMEEKILPLLFEIKGELGEVRATVKGIDKKADYTNGKVTKLREDVNELQSHHQNTVINQPKVVKVEKADFKWNWQILLVVLAAIATIISQVIENLT